MREYQRDRKRKCPGEESKEDNQQLKKIEELNLKITSLEQMIDEYDKRGDDMFIDREKLAKLY